MAAAKAKLCLIMARAENGTIGVDNTLPWRISADLKYFKRMTQGKPVVMGRKTFDSIGKPLKGRTNIVVTRQKEWSAPGVTVCHDIRSAVDTAKAQAVADGVDEVMIMGGAELYARLLIEADRFYLTEVHRPYEGDAWFTAPDKTHWKEVSRERFAPDEEGGPPYSFVVLERR